MAAGRKEGGTRNAAREKRNAKRHRRKVRRRRAAPPGASMGRGGREERAQRRRIGEAGHDRQDEKGDQRGQQHVRGGFAARPQEHDPHDDQREKKAQTLAGESSPAGRAQAERRETDQPGAGELDRRVNGRVDRAMDIDTPQQGKVAVGNRREPVVALVRRERGEPSEVAVADVRGVLQREWQTGAQQQPQGDAPGELSGIQNDEDQAEGQRVDLEDRGGGDADGGKHEAAVQTAGHRGKHEPEHHRVGLRVVEVPDQKRGRQQNDEAAPIARPRRARRRAANRPGRQTKTPR